MIEMRFQIVFTYKCNLNCQWCDRFMSSVPWEDSDITAHDLILGAEMVKESRVRVSRSRIGGGESMLHPEFVDLCKIVVEKWSRNGQAKTTVATNGTRKRKRGIGVRYLISPPDSKSHRPCMISPHDLGVKPRNGFVNSCRVQNVCGRGFDAFGFSPCPYAGPIGRVIGVDPYQPMPVSLCLPDICKHCIHSLSRKTKYKLWTAGEEGEFEFPTKTFKEGMKNPIEIKRFKERV